MDQEGQELTIVTRTVPKFVVLFTVTVSLLRAQDWNPGQELNAQLQEATDGRLQVSFEERVRFEARTGNNFGNSPDLENPLIRTRIGATWLVTDWFKISAMGQDCRAPDYGGTTPLRPATPWTCRKAISNYFRTRQLLFGAVFGRQMVTYGEGRLIGVPQWRNTSQTFDTARFHFLVPGGQLRIPDGFSGQSSARRVRSSGTGRSRRRDL